MKSNAEIRNLAWKRLWADHWFGRLFGGGLLLGLCGYAIQVVLGGLLGRFGVQDWMTYLQLVAQHRMDAKTPVPNLTPDFISQTCSATVLTTFFSFIMAGIVSYGCAVILKRCLANEENGWLGEAFGGFKCPFGMLWHHLRIWFIWTIWSFLVGAVPGFLCGIVLPRLKGLPPVQMAVAAGVGAAVCLCWAVAVLSIPFYRYRFFWLVKANHPEWGAGQCLRFCRDLMKGNKLKSFKLDCSYWKAITLMLLPLLVLALTVLMNEWYFGEGPQGLAVIAIVAFLCVIVFLPLAIVVPQYISVGQGFLYEELKLEQKEREHIK